jgi:uncharacterized protein YndB with AHSA1/START domain
MRHTASVVIDRPIREVFAYATNPDCWSEWIAALSQVECHVGASLEVGTTFAQVDQLHGGIHTTWWQVTEYEPPRALTCRQITGPDAVAVHQRFETVDGATQLTMCSEGPMAGPFQAGPQVVPMIAAQLPADLGRLKVLLEARGAVALEPSPRLSIPITDGLDGASGSSRQDEQWRIA